MGRPSPIDIDMRALAASPGRRRMFARRLVDSSALADEPDTIKIFDEIGMSGMSHLEFDRKLSGIKGPVKLQINSPGGSVFDGVGIFNALVRHQYPVHVDIVGLAASAAAFIAMAGDTITISDSSHVMIHAPWSLVVGPAEDMRKEADILDKLNVLIVDILAKRSKQPVSKVAKWVSDETWFNSAEALKFGFADEIVKTSRPSAKFDLDAYSKAPAELRANNTQVSNTIFSSRSELERVLRDRVGLSATAASKLVRGGFSAMAGFINPFDAMESAVANATLEIQRIQDVR